MLRRRCEPGQPSFHRGSRSERIRPAAATGIEKLQLGERCAILLAEAISADIILLDEKSARRVAAERGLRVTGTLGVLGEAAARGLVDFTPAVDRLRKTNFRYSAGLLKAAIDRYGPRLV
jgi:predicted nucleic acid-binding protein